MIIKCQFTYPNLGSAADEEVNKLFKENYESIRFTGAEQAHKANVPERRTAQRVLRQSCVIRGTTGPARDRFETDHACHVASKVRSAPLFISTMISEKVSWLGNLLRGSSLREKRPSHSP
jgi:hypothetical protein